MCTAAGLRVGHLELCTYSYTRNVARAWLAFIACLAKRHLKIQHTTALFYDPKYTRALLDFSAGGLFFRKNTKIDKGRRTQRLTGKNGKNTSSFGKYSFLSKSPVDRKRKSSSFPPRPNSERHKWANCQNCRVWGFLFVPRSSGVQYGTGPKEK